MRRVLAFVLASAAIAAAQQVTGVMVRDLRFDPSVSTLTYVLVNQSTKRAVAWTMKETAVMPGGVTREMGKRSVDMGRMPAPPPGVRRPQGFGPLEPNEIRKQVDRANFFAGNGPDAVDFRLEMLAVIYEDGSAEGDPKEVAAFRNRRTTQDTEMKKWLPRFRAVLDQQDMRGALRRLHDDLIDADAAAQKELFGQRMTGQPEMDPRMARMNLLSTIRNMSTMPDDALRTAVERFLKRAEAGEL